MPRRRRQAGVGTDGRRGVWDALLSDPLNQQASRFYRDAVDEFAAKLAAHRADFAVYDKLLEHLVSVLIERDADLRANKRLTRTVFYYMYWTCDIGSTVDGETNAATD